MSWQLPVGSRHASYADERLTSILREQSSLLTAESGRKKHSNGSKKERKENPRMIEYKVVPVVTELSVELTVNRLAQDGWKVVCSLGDRAVIMDRITENKQPLAEMLLRDQFTFSLPFKYPDEEHT